MFEFCIFVSLLIIILCCLAEEDLEQQRQELENAKMDEAYYQCINRASKAQFE